MQRLILMIGLILMGPISYSQNCTSGCTTTITVSALDSTDHTASNGDVICIVGNGTYTGNLSISDDDVTVCIDEDVIFESDDLENTATTVINNYGTMIISGDITIHGELNNYGVIISSGNVSVASSGSLISVGDSLVMNSLDIDGDVNISGDAIIDGDLTIGAGGGLNIQDGTISVLEDFINAGTVSASGSYSCGAIAVSGSSSNLLGAEFGTDGSSLDLCDSSSMLGGFDNLLGGLVGMNVTNCSNCSNTPLPVELGSIKVEATESSNIIQWQTWSEYNNSHFTVEKSSNGRDFTSIAKVNGHGTTKQAQNYTYHDTEILNLEIVYYRVKQVDFDGTFTHSRILEVKRNRILRLNYNETSKMILLSIPKTFECQAQLNIVSLNGQNVFSTDQLLKDGFSKDLSYLKRGIYIVKYDSPHCRVVKRVLVR